MLECVLNISEGRDTGAIEAIGRSAGDALLDVHTDADHHRSVLTLIGVDAPRAVTRSAVERLDIRRHDGVHPRIGVVDVVPFVPLEDTTLAEACIARDEFAEWAATELGVPCFLYGPERTLPDIRKHAFSTLSPDLGPATPHRSAGAIAVGARPVLVAYNLWLRDRDIDLARTLARSLRSPSVRTLALWVGAEVQVSMNLIDTEVTGPADVYDAVAAVTAIARAELVGLVPAAVLHRIPATRWADLDLDESKTIEARLEANGLGRA